MAATTETREFKTELKQLLHIITHSLYSHRDIFLRELISNASDAVNKARFDSLDNDDKLEGDKDWKIRLGVDKEAGTLTVSDNGIGMDREGAVENLGTIAKSGTRAFLETLKSQEGKARPELIGQFGVGFYSAFMVADKVTVYSRTAGSPADGVRWESDGQGEFTLEPFEKPRRGTDVVLHLKDDAKQYLEEWELKSLVKKFSDFVEHPVVMDVEEEQEGGEKTTKEEVLNSRKALWLRHKNEVTPEEYEAFYSQISGDHEKPAKVLHYLIEGGNEYRALLFIPAKKPYSFDWEEPKGVRLYIQRVLIMESCEGLLPPYLRFVRGVVDSTDLPLNISRELLQQNPVLERIQKNLVRNVLDALEGMKNTEEEKYRAFYQQFRQFIKQGISQDYANRTKLADLMLLESMNTEKGKFTTLREYAEKMPESQKEIHYLIGENRDILDNSPLLEGYKARGEDVLLLTDPADEFAIPSLYEYQKKPLKAIDQADAKDDTPVEGAEAFEPLLKRLKELLPEVKSVRLSKRLEDSAAVLVAEAGGHGAHFERLMQRMGRETHDIGPQRVLELNPKHAIVAMLRDLPADSPKLELVGRLLYDQAVVAEGSKVLNPKAFAARINELILKGV